MKRIILSAIMLTTSLNVQTYAQNIPQNIQKEVITDYSFNQVKAGNFTLDIFNASEKDSFGVASVIISGEKEAILIDAQFTLKNAELVAKKIKSTGKDLKSIYISHNDPDFYFGLEIIKKYFPNATAYATAPVVEQISKTAQKKLEVWGARLGDKITSNVVLPQVIKNYEMELEGQKLEIIGMNEHPSRTFVWIPSAKTVVGGINIFGNHFHPWMADAQSPEARQQWISVLDKISDLNPQIVIPAHGQKGDALDLKSVKHTKDYITFYEKALKKSKTSEELINIIKKKYPSLNFETALQIGAKVNTGEMPW